MSPVTARRHGLMFGQVTLNRASIRRSVEVWSRTWLSTMLPRDHGEMTSSGTRKPRPMGKFSEKMVLTSPTVVTVDAPSEPSDATGGLGVWLWSTNWPPSS